LLLWIDPQQQKECHNMPSKLPLRSLTRLVVGGVLSGLDLLSVKLETWEKQADQPAVQPGPMMDTPAALSQPGSLPSPYPMLPPTLQPHNINQVEIHHSETHPIQTVFVPDTQETDGERLSYVVTGWLFSGQDRLAQYGQLTVRAMRLAGNWAELLGGPLYNSRMMSPLRRGLDGLSERGQQTVDSWMRAGRIEAERSRRVAGVALTERVDKAIDYLTANEEVQELVQSQSAGLIDEVIEEARERTVSADNFLEAVVRSVLRRPPRWELPEPPQEVKQQAEHTARQIHGRTLHK
jgi:hypothetical protein